MNFALNFTSTINITCIYIALSPPENKVRRFLFICRRDSPRAWRNIERPTDGNMYSRGSSTSPALRFRPPTTVALPAATRFRHPVCCLFFQLAANACGARPCQASSANLNPQTLQQLKNSSARQSLSAPHSTAAPSPTNRNMRSRCPALSQSQYL